MLEGKAREELGAAAHEGLCSQDTLGTSGVGGGGGGGGEQSPMVLIGLAGAGPGGTGCHCPGCPACTVPCGAPARLCRPTRAPAPLLPAVTI